MMFCNELLNAGQTEGAIVELEKFLEELIPLGISRKTEFKLRKMLATGYMRLAEESNCLDQRKSHSCIIPIKGNGIYDLKSGSKSAIRILEDILKIQPDDYETLWMLNIAYMTLGEYPKKVPKEFLIPEKAFKSDYEISEFREVAIQSGLDMIGLSGACCIDDFNNDGYIDVVASSSALFDQIRVFMSRGDGTFEDQTDSSGILGITGGLNIIHTDYNNDGWLDIFILRGGWMHKEGKIPNSLLRNNQDGTFTDVTIDMGLLSFAPTQTAVWADFNNDGWLDLFVGNESLPNSKFLVELYINNEAEGFLNVTASSGLTNLSGYIKGVTAGDIDNDGQMDLYISNYGSNNQLLHNLGTDSAGIPKFEEIAQNSGVDQPIYSFPTWFWDYNNDGLLDIFVSGYPVQTIFPAQDMVAYLKGEGAIGTPILYKNIGERKFQKVTKSVGLNAPLYTMGCNYGDLDNDGFLDFYVATGDPNFTSIVPNMMFRNNSGRKFEDITTSGGFGHMQKGHGVGFADFDNDGDEDVYCVLGGAFEGDVYGNVLFENPVGNHNNWINLRLIGTNSNRAAIGARVKLTVSKINGSNRDIYRTVGTGASFGSNSLDVEIGFGKAIDILNIQVIWPNKTRSKQEFKDVNINSFVQIIEGDSIIKYLERKSFEFP